MSTHSLTGTTGVAKSTRIYLKDNKYLKDFENKVLGRISELKQTETKWKTEMIQN
jgi:hypothetical protein